MMRWRCLSFCCLGWLMIGGCGDGGNPPGDKQVIDQHPTLNDERAAGSNQTPAGTEQHAPLNPQNPPLSSSSDSVSLTELCVQVCQRSIALGCDEPGDCNEACQRFTVIAQRGCTAEIRNLFSCALANVTTCEDQTAEAVCATHDAAWQACTEALDPPDPPDDPDPPASCTLEGDCACDTDCETCLCEARQQAEFCTQRCPL